MTTAELLRAATNVAFLAVFALTAWDAFRRPRRDRVIVALLFALPAGAIALGPLEAALGVEIPSAVAAVLVMAIPYVTLQALADLADIPRPALVAAFAGFVVSAAVATMLPQDPTGPSRVGPLVVIVVYFFAAEAYAAWGTIRAANRARGVTRARLIAIAAGTLLLGLAILNVGAALAVPALAGLTQVLALGSALAYYVGFAPPSALRHIWQVEGLRDFLRVAAEAAQQTHTERALAALAAGCASALGAPRATASIRMSSGHVRIVTSDGSAYDSAPEMTVGGQAMELGRAVVGAPRPEAGWAKGMSVAIAAPVLAGSERLGFVSAFAKRPSLFLEEDLALLQLLADQASVVLQNRKLYDELASANQELERRFHELNSANAELGSFSYSVSHDLRAPLRSLDGFSHALLERYHDVLDETGRRYLGFLRESSQEMGQLIDDLLRLSLVTRSEMKTEDVDISGMAGDVIARLRRGEPARAVRVTIEPGLRVNGDPSLIRAALENLISNAWKFTSKRPLAEIAIGRVEKGRDTFFVRDNGAGFDMQYASKLFGAFQRLHAKNEFPGTGIGLATVQRVARRHGGEVWANAEPDRGATFYFTFGPRALSPEREENGVSQEKPLERMAS